LAVTNFFLKLLPELVSGRGTAGRSPVVEGLPLAAALNAPVEEASRFGVFRM
jgi:hypothetical protein